MGREEKKRRAAIDKLINKDQPDPNDSHFSAATGVPIKPEITGTELPEPSPPAFKKGETTSAPAPLDADEIVRGKTDFSKATVPGAIVSILTGQARILVPAALLIGLICCLFFYLWMLKNDNDKGLLTWPSGYIDSLRKLAFVASVFATFALLGVFCFGIYRLGQWVLRLIKSLNARFAKWRNDKD